MKKATTYCLLLIFVSACGARNPEPATSLSSPSARLSHATFTSCNSCHGEERPPVPHPPSGDCVSCHKFPSWDPI